MNKKTEALVLGILSFGLAALWAVKGCDYVKTYKDINSKEFSDGLAEELQKGFEELEGKI